MKLRCLVFALSLCAVLALTWLLAKPARAEPVRILVSAGHALGLSYDLPLHHAHRDADRVREVMTSLGGVRPDHAIVLHDPTPAALLGALTQAEQIAHGYDPREVVFLFYFSGHGDREKLHLGGDVLPTAQLSSKISSIGASLRIIVTDACRTRDTREKGISQDAPFSISLRQAPSATGLVWLHASADGEVAQESDELQGAIFTHYWLSGLSGAADANGDRRVTLTESYDFAYNQTLFRSARTSGVLQRPAADLELKEAAPFVLTQTTHESTALSFPQSTDTHYLVYAVGAKAVLAELWSAADRKTILAVPAGRYLVQRRNNAGGAAIEVNLQRGEQRDLQPSEFRPVAPEVLARKGGAVILDPHEVGLEYGAATSRVTDYAHQLALYYGYRFDSFALSGAVEGSLGSLSNSANNIQVKTLGAALRFEFRPRMGPMTLRLGLGGAGHYLVQEIDRRDAGRVVLGGYSTHEQYAAFAFGPNALLRLRFPLTDRLAFDAGADGSMLFAQFGNAAGPLWIASARAGFAFSF